MTSENPQNPFPGLRSYGPEAAHLFFGREAQIKQLRTKLTHHRFIAVVGRSGDGKSSLVRAGLIPQLLAEPPAEGREPWIVEEMRPQGAPLEELARLVDRLALRCVEGVDRLPEEMRLSRTQAMLGRSSQGLSDLLAQTMRGRQGPLLVLVDQFEELFRFDRRDARPEDFEEAAAFVELLLKASRSAQVAAHVILTMRSDFLGDCPKFRNLPEAINDSQFLVPRLNRDERRRVIEGPVARFGAAVEPPLLQRLLNDAGDAPDMLPVLQHALMRTWSHAREGWSDGDTHRITLKDYRDVGGISGALSSHAEIVFQRLPPGQQAYAGRIFRALVDTDTEGRVTRRTPAPRLGELIELCDGDENSVRAVLDAFRAEGRHFLMPPAERALETNTVIDISHEALARRWDRVADWVMQEQEDARFYRMLVEEVEAETQYLPPAVARSRLSWWDRSMPSGTWSERYGGRFADVSALLERSRRQLKLERVRRAAPLVALIALALVAIGTLALTREFAAREAAEKALVQAEEARDLAEAAEQRAKSAQKRLEAALVRTSIETSRRLAAQADELVAQGKERLALQLIHSVLHGEAKFEDEINYPPVPELQAAAYAALTRPFWHRIPASEGYRPYKVKRLQPSSHEDRINTVAFSPDGKRIITASDDGSARLWDSQSGAKIHAFCVDGDRMRSAAFSADGSTLVTTADDGTARYWDAKTFEAGQVFNYGARTAVVSGDPSHDGSRLAIAMARLPLSAKRGDALVQGRGKGATVPLKGDHGLVLGAAFSPDGARVVTAMEDRTARIWDSQTGEQLLELIGHQGTVRTAAFSPDGKQVVTASWDRTAILWDSKTGAAISILRGHQDAVRSAAFSPDGTRVVTASDDGTARIWQADGGTKVLVLRGHGAAVRSAAFSPDGARVVTGSADGTARLWNAVTGEETESLRVSGGTVAGVAYGPDRRRLLTRALDAPARLWDLESGREIAVLRDTAGDRINACRAPTIVEYMTFSPDGTQFVTVSQAGKAEVRGTNGGARVATLGRHGGRILKAVYAPNGERLATLSSRGEARVWDTFSWRRRETLQGHKAGLLGAAFAPDGKRLVTTSYDRTARIWDVNTGQLDSVLEGHEDWVRDAAFSPDGRLIATASDDTTVRIWDAKTGGLKQVLSGHELPVQTIEFTTDGTDLVTTSWDGVVRTWHTADWKALEAAPRGQTLADPRIRGKVGKAPLVAALWSGAAQVLDPETGIEMARIQTGVGPFWSLAVAPGHHQFASANLTDAPLLWIPRAPVAPRLLAHGSAKAQEAWLKDLAAAPTADGLEVAKPKRFGSHEVVLDMTRGGKRIRLMRREGKRDRALLPLPSQAGRVRDVVFSADGNILLVLADTLSVWKIPDESDRTSPVTVTSPIARFGGSAADWEAVAVAPSGGEVAARLADGSIEVWPVHSSVSELANLIHGLALQEMSEAQKCEFGLLPKAECSGESP